MQFFKQTSLSMVIVLAAVSSSWAQSDESSVLLNSQGCRLVGSLAKTVMGERQNEVPISEMMQRIQGSISIIGFDGLPIDENGLAKMVLLAYEMPRYHSPELQRDAISGFRNAVEKQCYNQQLQGD